ncbi:MAG: hypothetical protein IJD39_03075 [Clostridia bacterium]|nr:hypothetical protein [Clostridia bacterium]
MKKLLVMCLALMLIALPALSETTIFCAGREGDTAYEISRLMAERMNGEMVSADTHDEAVNLFLAAEKDSAVYIGDPSAMILSLQGYTDDDLRTAVLPVARIAASPATLYATQGVFSLCEDTTEEGLTAFTENAPFELFIARLIDASPVDFLTLEATSLFYVDQSLYMDWAEMAQAAQDGIPDLCVFGAEIPAELDGLLTPLYAPGLEGPFLGAFVQTDCAAAGDVEKAILAFASEEEIQALLQQAGYTPGSQLDAAAFGEEVKALFQRYIQYLTNEGLFFYEF